MTITTSAIKFAYWVPNVKWWSRCQRYRTTLPAGLYDYAAELAQTARTQAASNMPPPKSVLRLIVAENQHESVSFSHALLAKTEKLKIDLTAHFYLALETLLAAETA